MKYYSEEDTKDLRLTFEDKILRWPQVSRKKMFACPCYHASGKIFAFLVTKGIVITQLDQADREALSCQQQIAFFEAGGRIVQSWARVPVENKRDLDHIIPFVRRSYESVVRKA